MADAVLQNYELGPALNAGTFVEAMHNSIDAEQHRKDQDIQLKQLAEREKERQDALKSQNSEFLAKQYSKDKYIGTIHNGDYGDELSKILLNGQNLISNGAQMPDVMAKVGPAVADLDQRYKTEADMKTDIDANLERFKGVPGVNQEALRAHTYGGAFRTVDPKTGQYGGSKPWAQLSPNTDHVQAAIDAHAEDIYDNNDGLDAAVTKFNKNKTPIEQIGTATIDGREYDTGYTGKQGFWQSPSTEKDKFGNPVGLVTRGSIVTASDGNPIKDEDGKPMKVVPDDVYKAYANEKSVLPRLRAMTIKAFRESGEKIPDKNDPRWEMWQKHELYNYLETLGGGEYKSIGKETEESKKRRFEASPEHLNSQRAGAYQRRVGTIEADEDNGITPNGGKQPKDATSVASAVASVYQGKFAAPIVTYDGKKYEDIHSAFPDGDLKYGKSAKETYDKLMFDPETNEIVTVKKDDHNKDVVEKWPESKAGQFIGFHAEANGKGGISANRKDFQASGYTNGAFGNHRTDGGEAVKAATKVENDQKIDDSIKGEDYSGLESQNITTPDGKVTKVGEISGWNLAEWGGNKYYIQVGDKEKRFKTKEQMAAYLKGGANSAAKKAILD